MGRYIMNGSGRVRLYCVTDYERDISFWKELLDKETISFYTWGEEVCPSTGRNHWQSWVHFTNTKSFSAAQKILKPRHILTMRGSIHENDVYCSKESELQSIGVKPICNKEKGKMEKRRWEKTWESAKIGNLEEIDAEIRIKHYGTLKQIRMDYMQKPSNLDKVCGIWIYGDTNTGKSYLIDTQFPECYKKPANKQWNGYQGEEVVHIEDLDKSHHILGHYLKIWADRYYFQADIKYGAINIRPRKFIVTSNYHPDEIGFSEGCIEAIKRRFRIIKKDNKEQFFIL